MLRKPAHDTTRVRSSGQLTGGSDRRYRVSSSTRGLTQCVLVGEKKVVLGDSLTGVPITLGDANSSLAS